MIYRYREINCSRAITGNISPLFFVQWGKYSISAGANSRKQTFSYPVAFSNACYATIGIDDFVATKGEWINSVVVTEVTKNNFTVGVGHSEASTFWAVSIGK